ncbi:MAG TPA: hypothetical protein VFU20_09075 [Sphingomicrobium sp.]|nr:hypothetical protein [Sphingomicrobium sp.]
MRILNLRTAAIVLAAGAGLGGCATYSPFGYGSGVSVSYGDRGYYDPYYGGYGYGHGYSPYGYRSAYGYSPYWGWNNGYYYPGTGYYVYDRYRRPRVWTDAERQYWTERANSPGTTTTRRLLDNWADFSNGGQTTQSTQTTRSVRESDSSFGDRRAARRAQRIERATRPTAEREQSTRIERRIERARSSGRVRVVGGERSETQPE